MRNNGKCRGRYVKSIFRQFFVTFSLVPADIIDGGWGYLQFVDLGMYYVHGRWYRPDIGRFISPDEGGSYIYVGNDGVNRAWTSGGGLSAPGQQQGQPPGFIRTKDYGYIDLVHLDAATNLAKDMLDQMRSNRQPIRAILPIPRGPYFLNVIAEYTVYQRPYDQTTLKSMVLGMFMDYEWTFESEERGPLGAGELATGTSFSIEDLPTDYLGFYAASEGLDREGTIKRILPILGEDANNPQYSFSGPENCRIRSLCGDVKNYEFTPRVQVPRVKIGPLEFGSVYVNKDWPAALQMTPSYEGWRRSSCRVQERFFGQNVRLNPACTVYVHP